MTFKPMLSGKAPADLSKLTYPLLASPKLDGIRAVRLGNRLVSRTLKDIPNRYVREWCINNLPEGLDGELLLRDWTAPLKQVTSAIMSRDGEPDFVFAAFDWYDPEVAPPEFNFGDRIAVLAEMIEEEHDDVAREHLQIVPHLKIVDQAELETFDDENCHEGYEGTMVRSLDGPYKFGRSTTKEGYLLKIKRFVDEEAYVVGFVEEMHNTNEATKDHLGHTKRSSAKAGKVGKGTLGAFVCMFEDGTDFECGSGFTAEERAELWDKHVPGDVDSIENKCHILKDGVMTDMITVKHLPPPGGRQVGEKPRHPVFKGFRKD